MIIVATVAIISAVILSPTISSAQSSCPPSKPTTICNGTWQTTQLGIANTGNNCTIGWMCVSPSGTGGATVIGGGTVSPSFCNGVTCPPTNPVPPSCPSSQPTIPCNGTWQTTQLGIANTGNNCTIGWMCVPPGYGSCNGVTCPPPNPPAPSACPPGTTQVFLPTFPPQTQCITPSGTTITPTTPVVVYPNPVPAPSYPLAPGVSPGRLPEGPFMESSGTTGAAGGFNPTQSQTSLPPAGLYTPFPPSQMPGGTWAQPMMGTTGTTGAGYPSATSLQVGMQNQDIAKLQSLLSRDPSLYPEGSVTGYFGPATRRAIIRFQEKYANEILRPNGLSRGTGIIGPATLKKLNALAQ